MEKENQELLDQFRKDLHSLANYLEGKEPFEEEEIQESRSWLLKIENMMGEAIEKIDDADIAKIIKNAMDALPDIDTNPDEWHEGLYKASDLLGS